MPWVFYPDPPAEHTPEPRWATYARMPADIPDRAPPAERPLLPAASRLHKRLPPATRLSATAQREALDAAANLRSFLGPSAFRTSMLASTKPAPSLARSVSLSVLGQPRASPRASGQLPPLPLQTAKSSGGLPTPPASAAARDETYTR